MNPTQMDKKTFLAHLRRSGLLSRHELAALKGRLPHTRRGRLIARDLVERGLLTKFQAELLLAGRTSGFFLGQYRILEQIGQGGMGRVFKAVHRTMKRVVALKLLAPHLTGTEKAQRLFQREAQAAARLIHPNIVTAYDANHIGNRHYLVMEYVNGPNLEQLVRDCGPLSIGLACELIRQVAHGLQYALEMGMVHRDIKPANILADGLEQVLVPKITDFGLARLSDDEQASEPGTVPTRPNVAMGTPDFLSPEQARGLQDVDIRSDLYSLGCTLYFLLAGEVPFPGGNPLNKLLRHSTEEPAPIEGLRADLPLEIVQIVRKLMAKDVQERFQTPLEVAQVLTQFARAELPRRRALKEEPLDSESAVLDTDRSQTDQDTPRPSSSGSLPRAARAKGASLSQSPPVSDRETPESGLPAPGQWARRHRLPPLLGIAAGVIVLGLALAGWLLLR
jgi:serine/threonine-protein kinase